MKKMGSEENSNCGCFFSPQVLSALDILQPPHIDYFEEMYPSLLPLPSWWYKTSPMPVVLSNVFLSLLELSCSSYR